jgi:hypothetical protein
MDCVTGKRLHGDKLIHSRQKFFKETMSGRSWGESILDSLTKGGEAFAGAVKIIQKNLDDFVKRNG